LERRIAVERKLSLEMERRFRVLPSILQGRRGELLVADVSRGVLMDYAAKFDVRTPENAKIEVKVSRAHEVIHGNERLRSIKPPDRLPASARFVPNVANIVRNMFSDVSLFRLERSTLGTAHQRVEAGVEFLRRVIIVVVCSCIPASKMPSVRLVARRF
jgi:hypothetical protein